MTVPGIKGALCLCVLVLGLDYVYAFEFAGGTGEPNAPYQIATREQLLGISSEMDLIDKSFILTADIDLDPNLPGGQVFERAVIAHHIEKDYGRMVIVPFAGEFDGNHYTIFNMHINGDKNLGLFGVLGADSIIRNVVLSNAYVHGYWGLYGALAGNNKGVVEHCGSIDGRVERDSGSGRFSIRQGFGGLLGSNRGTVRYCYSIGTVGGTEQVGGLIGENYSGQVRFCYSISTVQGFYHVGGLIGENDSGDVSHCYSQGSVKAWGTTSNKASVGGLVGTTGSDSGNPSVRNCYSACLVEGGRYAGGLIGQKRGGNILGCVWDTGASNLTGSAGGVGLNSIEIMDPNMLALNGWADDPNWVLDAGYDYPRLTWEGTVGQRIGQPNIDWLGGEGTTDNPHLITTADQLILLSKASHLWDRSFALEADIDLDPNLPGRRVFGQAVFPEFYGAFDGQGHVIRHLTIVGGSNLGFVGFLNRYHILRTNPAVLPNRLAIYNLNLEDVYIEGDGSGIGALVGNNHGGIWNCSCSGRIQGTGRGIGGLVGFNIGDIQNCQFRGTVNGDDAEIVIW